MQHPGFGNGCGKVEGRSGGGAGTVSQGRHYVPCDPVPGIDYLMMMFTVNQSISTHYWIIVSMDWVCTIAACVTRKYPYAIGS